MDYLGSTSIIIGDYEWDYRLWSYVLTQDRDARELLTADYHVVRATDGSGTLIRAEGEQAGAGALGQALAPSHRAGMITTTWFMAINTIFTPLPRTKAAQPYSYNLSTGMPDPSVSTLGRNESLVIREGHVYSLICHALGIDFPGRIDMSGLVQSSA